MKKKILFVFLLFLGVSGISLGQDFEPGEQAQGYLNNKNTSVDKTTGVFQYSIPLFAIVSDKIQLPVTLNYSSSVKKSGNARGIIGFGWNMQTGGIVTRTIRGGIADETPKKGYIFCPQENLLSQTGVSLVNRHGRDGECDLFTTVFNGRSVHFIIKKKDQGIEAIPLERTNVKITCEYDGRLITGWRVLDDNGIEYIYRETEWLMNIRKDANVLTNSIRDSSYISSWYLNQIKVPNGPDVNYCYEREEITDGQEAERLSFPFHDVNRTTFYYGVPLVQLSFQMGDRDEEFHKIIETIRSIVSNRYSISLWGNSAYKNTSFYNDFYTSEREMEYLFNQITTFESVMGIAAKYPSTGYPSFKYTEILKNLYTQFQHDTEIRDYIFKALNILRFAMMNNTRTTSYESLYTEVNYSILTPRLNKISCGNREIIVNIDTAGYLRDVTSRDYKGDQEKRIVFEYDSGYLSDVRWLGENNVVYQEQGLFYQDKLLSRIRYTQGGEIGIIYEPLVSDMTEGEGVRVKSIISRGFASAPDTVNYRYPYAGISVYDDISYRDTICYIYTDDQLGKSLSFSDKIVSSDLKYKGNACLQTGNNGIYYHYVEEELVGKGTNTYLFSIASPSKNNRNKSYSFWVSGLPLARASYDINGKLVSLSKNRYYTDISVSDFSFGRDWFDAVPDASFGYTSGVYQTKFNENDVSTSLSIMNGVKAPVICIGYDWDVTRGWHEWTVNPTMLNYRNILIRSNQDIHPCYKFMYGGKTVLKSTKEYMIVNTSIGGPSMSHLTGSLPIGAILISEVEYCYDNPELNPNPTRVINTRNNGDRVLEVRRSVLDILPSSSYPFINEMKTANLVAPVIKEQKLLQKQGESRYILLNESVIKYEKRLLAGGNNVFLPVGSYRFIAPGSVDIASPGMSVDAALFSAGFTSYQEEIVNYREGNESWLVSEYQAMTGNHVYCHDAENNSVILDAINVNREGVDAVDKYRVLCNSGKTSIIPGMDGITLSKTLTVVPSAGCSFYRLVVLIKPTGSKLSVKYTVTRFGENSTATIEHDVIAGLWQTVVFDIPTGDTRSLVVQLPDSGLASASLVPSSVIFKASSFEPSGRIFATYDQNGVMKRQEYDEAGRVIRIYDECGNLLQSFEYKTLY